MTVESYFSVGATQIAGDTGASLRAQADSDFLANGKLDRDARQLCASFISMKAVMKVGAEIDNILQITHDEYRDSNRSYFFTPEQIHAEDSIFETFKNLSILATEHGFNVLTPVSDVVRSIRDQERSEYIAAFQVARESYRDGLITIMNHAISAYADVDFYNQARDIYKLLGAPMPPEPFLTAKPINTNQLKPEVA
jgi:hypothetical protein